MNDRLAVFFDPCVFDHDTGRGFFEAQASPYLPIVETHPENSERLRNMHGVLKEGPIADALDWHAGETANRADLERFHTAAYIDELASVPEDATRTYSSTTIFGPGSYAICCKAAGLAISAANHVYTGQGPVAYAMSRPPGASRAT